MYNGIAVVSTDLLMFAYKYVFQVNSQILHIQLY